MNYRPDIDGMRAVAVLLVLLFHLDIEAFAGGYIGVDMFFVLSGYLITSIVWRQIESEQFGLLNFYARRVVRLMPPLVTTIVATAAAAAVIMDPRDFALFAETAVAALISLSNVLFFSQAGYWDTTGELKPLLHTWSLGIEEQFYIVWPAVLLLIHRRWPTAVRPVLTWVTAIGFVGALLLFRFNESAAFFLLPARVFQFSLGAVLGLTSDTTIGRLLRRRSTRDVVQLGAMAAAVLIATALLGPDTPYPGWRSLLPTVATAAALIGGVNGGGKLATTLLGNPLMLWLGRLSYSLYLTHWPIIALYRYRTGLELSPIERVWLLSAAVGSATALHYLVERRFYRRTDSHRTVTASIARTKARVPRVLMILSSVVVTAVALSHAALGDGWAWRRGEIALSVEAVDAGMQHRFDLVRSGCNIRNLSGDACNPDASTQALIIGNSHEPDGYNFLHGAYKDRRDLNLVSFGSTNQCDDLSIQDLSWRSTADDCQRRLDNLAQVISQFDYVVYAANRPFAPNKAETIELIAALRTANQQLQIVTVGGYINTKTDCARLINETGTAASCVDPANVSYFEANPTTQPLYGEVMAITDTFVDRVDLLCADRERSNTCRSETSDGIPMSYDQHHLSLEFAVEAGRLYQQRWGDLFGDSDRGDQSVPADPAAPSAPPTK